MRNINALHKLRAASHQVAKEKDYWCKKMAEEPVKTYFSYDYKKTADRQRIMNSLEFGIRGGLFDRLMQISNNYDYTLYMVLTAGLKLVLGKYTGSTDIIVGAPIYKQETKRDYLNTVLALRDRVSGGMTFKELLLQVKTVIGEADENKNYPIELLLEYLNMSFSGSDFPLFDIIVLLENIHDKSDTAHIPVNIIFNFKRKDTCIEGKLEYNAGLYCPATIRGIVSHFNHGLEEALADIDLKIGDINILSGQEQRQLLYNFNDTGSEYSRHKTIHELFEEQSVQTPDGVAVVGARELHQREKLQIPNHKLQTNSKSQIANYKPSIHPSIHGDEKDTDTGTITYSELNRRANQLAEILKEKGIQPDTIVGIMVERSVAMIIGILGILKAGGAYLPIDPDYPPERIDFMLKDSNAPLLLKLDELSGIGKDTAYCAPTISFAPCNLHRSVAYIIYTSGSTGTPKGVMVRHAAVVNLVHGLNERIYKAYGPGLHVCQVSPYIFDASVKQVFASLLLGHALYVVPEETRVDAGGLCEYFQRHQIDISDGTPAHLRLIVKRIKEGSGGRISSLSFPVTHFIIGGEVLSVNIVREFSSLFNPNRHKITNVYGPTECCVDATSFGVTTGGMGYGDTVPIGRPMPNTKIYIANRQWQLQPIGIPGELCIGGDGLARGYLNNPELTREKFHRSYKPDRSYIPGKIYKTGDLARWLPDGNLVFVGRIDRQVKIRGFRIELEEIENRLAECAEVKEAAVVVKEDKNGDKYLCAYIVAGDDIEIPGLKGRLEKQLPGHMIPSYFVKLENLPLTSNGKVDRKALPDPGVGVSGAVYIVPRDETERKLAEIWSKTLEIETGQTGIDDDFFSLGGHSLKANYAAAKIYEAFDIKLPLAKIFEYPTIRALAGYMKKTEADKYEPIEPAEKKEYYVLTPAQKRLYILQQMELESTGYNMPYVLPLEKDIHLERLEKTVGKLIARHESLRTSFRLLLEEPVQQIHDEVASRIEFYSATGGGGKKEILQEKKLPASDVSSLLPTGFFRPFDLSEAPLLRVGLIKEGNRYTLILNMHHIITDGTSQGILSGELSALYAGEELLPLALHYKDYAVWQNRRKQQEFIRHQEAHWLELFPDDLPVLNLPCDYPRPVLQSFAGSRVRFALDGEETTHLKRIAGENDATLYMTILSIFVILLAKLSGDEDIVVGTPIAGRQHPDTGKIIGMFVNTLAMRNCPGGDKTFTGFLAEVKKNTLAAYDNQAYPFDELVEKISPQRDTGRNPVFDVMLNLLNRADDSGAVSLVDKESGVSYENATAKFDLNLAAVDRGDTLSFHLEYCTKLFKKETVENFVHYFKQLAAAAIAGPGQRLSELEILSDEEKARILRISNGETVAFASRRTIPQMFGEAVEKGPQKTALVLGEKQVTYEELNNGADRLAQVLRAKGVAPYTVVGVMMERSIEMIIGITGILKAGGAYLPIDPGYPRDRIDYMLKDSGAGILLSDGIDTPRPLCVHPSREGISFAYGNPLPGLIGAPPGMPRQGRGGAGLAYVIYTSGSTGKPKGVMLEQRNLINLIHYQYKYTNIDFSRVLQFTTISFDVSFQEIFSTLLAGGELHLIREETRNDIPGLFTLIGKNRIKTLFLATGFLKFVFSVEAYINIFPKGIAHLVAAGEQIVVNDGLRKYLKENHVFLHNHYGPSETHVVTALTLEPTGEIPRLPCIGRPVSNTHIYILDKYYCLLPKGVSGELYIGGAQVGRGYSNRPELTAGRFKKAHENHELTRIKKKGKKGTVKEIIIDRELHLTLNTKHVTRNTRLYRTGDFARWLPDENIEFLGRLDHQVKIRGFRIELGEIESRLVKKEEIKEAVVLAKEKEDGEKYLCAYIVSSAGNDPGRKFDSEELRNDLSRLLPDYMVPAFFVKLDKIPLTPSGKINRKAFPEPGFKDEMQKYNPPRDEVERKLVEIWSRVLTVKKEEIGIDDDFFRLGGHSLKAAIVLAKVHKEANVKLPLAELFKTPTVKGLAECIRGSETQRYFSIKPVEEKEYYVLSSAQKRLYILQQMEADSISYNMPVLVKLEGRFDRERFEAAFRQLIGRHESLRTSFHLVGNEPVQRIHDDVRFGIEYFGAHDFHESGKGGHNKRFCGGPGGGFSKEPPGRRGQNFIRPFDLSTAPLFRVGLIHTPAYGPPSQGGISGDKHILMVDMHHIITDGTSLDLVTREFMKLYAGENPAPLPIRYKDFSGWQDSEYWKEMIKGQTGYWQEQFAGEIPVIHLPLDYPRPEVQCFQGRTISFETGEEETAGLNRLALASGTTLFMVLMALYNVFLSKMTGQEDIVVGTPSAGRRRADLQGIIGVFINTLGLRNYPAAEKTFPDFLAEVRACTLAAFDNQDYPFEELVEKAGVYRDTGRNPLFDVMLVLQNMEQAALEVPGLTVTPYPHENRVSKFDLSLYAVETGPRLCFRLQYGTALFRAETAERFTRYFKATVASVTGEPGQVIRDIDIVPGAEKKLLLETFNDTTLEYPADQTVVGLFEDRAARFPDRVAAVYEGQGSPRRVECVTYRELNRRAGQLAARLREKGAGHEFLVGLLVKRSVAMLTGIVGILKAGGAYVPLDPGYPVQRIQYILEKSGAKILLSQPRKLKRPLEALRRPSIEVLDIDNIPASRPFSHGSAVKPGQPAYVIFTSGSTGNPKGVIIEHGSVVNFIRGMAEKIAFLPGKVILALTTISFDIFVLETLLPLAEGLKIVIAGEGRQSDPGLLEAVIVDHGVDILQLTPSRLNLLLNGPGTMDCLHGVKEILVGGEAFPVQLFKTLKRGYGGKIFNVYGPTETTVWSALKDLSEAAGITIGTPTANTRIYILDRNNKIQLLGAAGELCIGGAGVGRGYLNNPELTAEKFDRDFWNFQDYRDEKKKGIGPKNSFNRKFLEGVQGAPRRGEPIRGGIVSEDVFHSTTFTWNLHLSPLAEKSPPGRRRHYKTGDLARWLPDGDLEFLGRIDRQVKVRGFRIELEEIEECLLSHKAVKGAAVRAVGGDSGDNALCAYYVSQNEIDFTVLREHLGQTLPDYMIPSYFVRLERLPLTPNGKIDRNALPDPEIRRGEDYVAPRDGIERKLAALWSDILGIEKNKIGIHAGFFRLGGHSLKATLLISRIHKEFDVRIPLAEIFRYPFIRGLAEYIKKNRAERYTSINPVEQKEYYALSSAQKRLYILQQMDERAAGYNLPSVLRMEGEPGQERLERIFRRLIERHESLRTSFIMVGNEPVQRVHEDVEFETEYFDLAANEFTMGYRAKEREENIIKNFIRPFDLSGAPLLRVGLIRSAPGKYILMVDMHHIISDGMSSRLTVNDFAAFYAGRQLPPLRLQYKDYACRQNTEREKEYQLPQVAYWQEQFRDDIPVPVLPADFPRPAVHGFEGGRLRFTITGAPVRHLKRLGLQQGATLFMVLLAIYNIFLSKISGQEDIVVGTPEAGRGHADLEPIVGMFVNTLALRNFPAAEYTFIEFLGRVRERALEAFANRDYPYEDLVEILEVERDAGRNPLFDTMFLLQDIHRPELQIPGLEIKPYEHELIGSKFDLTLRGFETENDLSFILEYSTKLFKKESIERFTRYFKQVVSRVCGDPDKKIAGIEIISEDEKKQVLFDFNDTGTGDPGKKTIHERFEDQVERGPDSVAVVGAHELHESHEGRKLQVHITYRELNEKSNGLARILLVKGVKTGTVAGILLSPSPGIPIAILAVLKAGGAFLAIEPEFPQERINYMLADSGAGTLVTKSTLAEPAPAFSTLQPLPPPACRSSDLAYAIYTSGSSGKPKGALLGHGNLLNYVDWFTRESLLTSADNGLLTSSYAFDLGYTSIFPSLVTGAGLHIIPKETYLSADLLLDYISSRRITYVKLTPSLFSIFFYSSLFSAGTCRYLRLVVLGGEPIDAADVEKAYRQLAHVRVLNHYGPTEATIGCIAQFVPFNGAGLQKYKENPTIGKPVSNTAAYILDKNSNPLPVGIPGELCIAGAGVGRGYLNNPELTREKFDRDEKKKGIGQKNSFNKKFLEGVQGEPFFKKVPPGRRRHYKTGDLARWLPDGNIEFLGRIDQQVKIRGYRIELGEIENRLSGFNGIKEAVVLCGGSKKEHKFLCAYIVYDQPGNLPDISELNGNLAGYLPDYMIPSHYIPLERIPLTPNGKLDRKALPEPGFLKKGEGYIPPTNETEEKLAGIWSEILEIEKDLISMDANFFRLGGNSLKATIMISKIHKSLHAKIPLAEIFKTPTVRGAAKYIKETEADRFIPIEPVEKKEYYALSSAQERLFILEQMRDLKTAYNLPKAVIIEGGLDRNRFDGAAQSLLDRHESLRTSFHWQGGEAVQRIHENTGLKIVCLEAQESEVPLIIKGFIQPFDLKKAPLVRVQFVRLAQEKHVMMFDMHHIISDGVSGGILARDFFRLYEGEELPGLKIQYKDFSQWQRRLFQSREIKSRENYWINRMKGKIPILDMPVDFPRPRFQVFEGDRIVTRIDSQLTGKFSEILAALNTTVVIGLLAVYNILLSRYTGQEDIIVGMPTAGRNHADSENVIGFFVNTLAVRNYPQADKTFTAFLEEVKTNALGAYENQDYPLEELVDRLNISRDTGRNPLFDVLLASENAAPRGSENKRLNLLPYRFENKTSHLDLVLYSIEKNDAIEMVLEYSTALFKPSSAENIMDRYVEILEQVVENKDIRLKDIEISLKLGAAKSKKNYDEFRDFDL